jgi:hypothetical protein
LLFELRGQLKTDRSSALVQLHSCSIACCTQNDRHSNAVVTSRFGCANKRGHGIARKDEIRGWLVALFPERFSLVVLSFRNATAPCRSTVGFVPHGDDERPRNGGFTPALLGE